MERVAVVGPAGAGKTQLARALGACTGLPVVHLDPIFWAAGWEPAPRDRAVRRLREELGRGRWVLDGNFLSADGGERFERADTVVVLDLPRRICVPRLIRRRIRDARAERPDLPAGCREGTDLELVLWVWRWRRQSLPRLQALLAEHAGAAAVHHLRSRRDVRRFLAGCG